MKNKYFEQKNFVKNYIYAITIFIITLVIGISIFFNVVQASVEKNSRETLITNVTQQSEHLNTILNINYSYLNVLAQELSKSEDLFSENNISLIKAFMENTDLNRTAIIDSDGNALYDNNVVKNVAHRRYFKESMQGKQSLSDPLESSVDQQTRVILSVPIYKNNQVIGVCCKIVRNNKEISCDNLIYKCVIKIWQLCMPIRHIIFKMNATIKKLYK